MSILKNYFIKNNEIYRKTHVTKNKTLYEKKIKIQRIGMYEYVYLNGKRYSLFNALEMLKK